MYCKECGTFLTGTENFCKNCGTRVEKTTVTNDVRMQTEASTQKTASKETVKFVSPVDDIVWDLEEFKTTKEEYDPKDFKWNTEGMFLNNEIRKEEEEHQKNLIAEEEAKAEADRLLEENRKKLQQDKNNKKQGERIGLFSSFLEKEKNNEELEKDVKIEEPIGFVKDSKVVNDIKGNEGRKSLFEEILPDVQRTLQTADVASEKRQIDKFYTFNKNKEEFQKLLDREYDRVERKCDNIGLESDIENIMDVSRGNEVEATTQLEEMIQARNTFFDLEVESVPVENVIPEIKEDVKSTEELDLDNETAAEINTDDNVEVVVKDAEVIFEPTDDISLEEKALEGQQVSEPSEVIDDMEVVDDEKIEATEEISEDVEKKPEKLTRAQRKELKRQEKDAKRWAKEQAKEAKRLAKNEAHFAEAETSEKVDEIEETTSTSEDIDNEVSKNEISWTKVEPSASSDIEEKELKEYSRDEIEEAFFENDEIDKTKKSKVAKVCLTVLMVIMVILIIIIGIKVLFPYSKVAETLDEGIYKIVHIFAGNNDSSVVVAEDRSMATEDKSGIIQLELKENYNDKIATIKYVNDAKYIQSKTYAFPNSTQLKSITENKWYKDDKKKQHYYDQEAVGSIIAFESSKMAYINDNDDKVFDTILPGSTMESALKTKTNIGKTDIDTLGIGDIRKQDDNLFVWVVEDEQKRVYQLNIGDYSLKVSAVWEA